MDHHVWDDPSPNPLACEWDKDCETYSKQLTDRSTLPKLAACFISVIEIYFYYLPVDSLWRRQDGDTIVQQPWFQHATVPKNHKQRILH